MQRKSGLAIGLLDNAIDNATTITNVALGVPTIEKHVTIDCNGDTFVDSSFINGVI
jgi:sialic acid synthase SpsE